MAVLVADSRALDTLTAGGGLGDGLQAVRSLDDLDSLGLGREDVIACVSTDLHRDLDSREQDRWYAKMLHSQLVRLVVLGENGESPEEVVAWYQDFQKQSKRSARFRAAEYAHCLILVCAYESEPNAEEMRQRFTPFLNLIDDKTGEAPVDRLYLMTQLLNLADRDAAHAVEAWPHYVQRLLVHLSTVKTAASDRGIYAWRWTELDLDPAPWQQLESTGSLAELPVDLTSFTPPDPVTDFALSAFEPKDVAPVNQSAAVAASLGLDDEILSATWPAFPARRALHGFQVAGAWKSHVKDEARSWQANWNDSARTGQEHASQAAATIWGQIHDRPGDAYRSVEQPDLAPARLERPVVVELAASIADASANSRQQIDSIQAAAAAVDRQETQSVEFSVALTVCGLTGALLAAVLADLGGRAILQVASAAPGLGPLKHMTIWVAPAFFSVFAMLGATIAVLAYEHLNRRDGRAAVNEFRARLEALAADRVALHRERADGMQASLRTGANAVIELCRERTHRLILRVRSVLRHEVPRVALTGALANSDTSDRRPSTIRRMPPPLHELVGKVQFTPIFRTGDGAPEPSRAYIEAWEEVATTFDPHRRGHIPLRLLVARFRSLRRELSESIVESIDDRSLDELGLLASEAFAQTNPQSDAQAYLASAGLTEAILAKAVVGESHWLRPGWERACSWMKPPRQATPAPMLSHDPQALLLSVYEIPLIAVDWDENGRMVGTPMLKEDLRDG